MKIFKKYDEESEAISSLNIPFKKKLPIILLSLLYALIILAIPITILANMYIFNDLRILVTGLIMLQVFLVFHITQLFYYRAITEGKLKYSFLILYESGFAFITCIISFIIILCMGVF